MAERIVINDKGERIIVKEIDHVIQISTRRVIPINPPVIHHIDAVKAADKFLKEEEENKKKGE